MKQSTRLQLLDIAGRLMRAIRELELLETSNDSKILRKEAHDRVKNTLLVESANLQNIADENK